MKHISQVSREWVLSNGPIEVICSKAYKEDGAEKSQGIWTIVLTSENSHLAKGKPFILVVIDTATNKGGNKFPIKLYRTHFHVDCYPNILGSAINIVRKPDFGKPGVVKVSDGWLEFSTPLNGGMTIDELVRRLRSSDGAAASTGAATCTGAAAVAPSLAMISHKFNAATFEKKPSRDELLVRLGSAVENLESAELDDHCARRKILEEEIATCTTKLKKMDEAEAAAAAEAEAAAAAAAAEAVKAAAEAEAAKAAAIAKKEHLKKLGVSTEIYEQMKAAQAKARATKAAADAKARLLSDEKTARILEEGRLSKSGIMICGKSYTHEKAKAILDGVYDSDSRAFSTKCSYGDNCTNIRCPFRSSWHETILREYYPNFVRRDE